MAEPDQPSTARMIDHLLGGEHHFPVDVAAARAFEELCAPVFRALSDFLGRAVDAIAGSGVDSFVVFGRWRPTAEGTLPIQVWRPDGPPAEVPDAFYGAVATKPLSGSPSDPVASGRQSVLDRGAEPLAQRAGVRERPSDRTIGGLRMMLALQQESP